LSGNRKHWSRRDLGYSGDITQRIVVTPYRRFGRTNRSHLQGSRPLKMGPIGCTETSVRSNHDTLRNILRRAQITSTSRRQSEITHDNAVMSLRALRSDSMFCLVSAGTASLKYRIYSKGHSSFNSYFCYRYVHVAQSFSFLKCSVNAFRMRKFRS